jgi:hypothetical protein
MRNWMTAKRVMLALTASATLWLNTCTMNLRDAIVGGALDFVAGSTTALIDAWFPIVPLLAPPEIDGGD